MAAGGWCSGDGPRCDLRCCDDPHEKGLSLKKLIPAMPHMVHKSKIKYLPKSQEEFIVRNALSGKSLQDGFLDLFSICYQKDVIETKPEIVKAYDVKNFQPSSIPWIVPTSDKTAALNPLPGRKSTLKEYLTSPQKLFWDAASVMIPTYLPPMYHNANVTEMLKYPIDNCAMLSTWYAAINEAFGINLMRTVNSKHAQFVQATTSNNVSKKMKTFKESFQNLLTGLRMSYCCPETPHSPDSCTTAQDFLLEPCILVQLPWKPVVLQQWLLGGLAVVLSFERESLELRHWPLPVDLKDCATQLLALVRDLKSRIILGFAIIGRMVHTHPDYDINFPQYLLEGVVLPSVPVLNLLISGEALQIIKNIQNVSWSESNYEKQLSFVFVPESAYKIQDDLMFFYSENYFNILCWIERKSSLPFPNPNFDIKEMIDKIKNFSFLNEETAANKPLSLEENKLLEMLQNNLDETSMKIDNKTRVKLTVNLMEQFVKDTGTLPDLTSQEIEKKMLNSKIYKKANDIFNATNCVSHVQSIRHAMLSQEIFTFRLLFEGEKSGVLSQIISLQLACIEQEQNVRLALACSRIFKLGLNKCNNESNCSDPVLIMSQIVKVEQEIDHQNYDLLLSQFDNTWKNDVDLNVSPQSYKICPKTKQSNGKHLGELFINRIGRLMYNIAKSHFEFCKISGDIKLYPHWNTIQYILPCFVTTVLSSEKSYKTAYLLKLFDLVNGVISFYEKSYLTYNPETITLSSIPSTLLKETEIQITNYYKAYGLLLLKYRDNIKLLLLTHTEEITYYHWDSTGIDYIVKMLVSWPYHFCCFSTIDRSFLPCLESWFNFAYNFVVDLLKNFYDSWKPLEPGAPISRIPKLGELHLANAIVSELETVFEIAVLNQTSRGNRDNELEVRLQICFCVNEERLNINRNIVGIKNKSDDYLNYVVDHGKDIVGNLYEKLKKFRQTSGTILKFQLFDKLPHLSNQLIKNAVTYYINGNLDALDQMLSVFEIPFVKKCRQCLKIADNLTACKKCVEQNYPDVHYYCCDKCQVTKWNSEHMEEHLEFELGITDFPEES